MENLKWDLKEPTISKALKDDDIIIAKDIQNKDGSYTGAKLWAVIPYDQYEDLVKEDHHLYEQIPKNKPVRLFGDIDIDRIDGEADFDDEELEDNIVEFVFKLILIATRDHFKYNDIDKCSLLNSEILIETAHTDKKFSLHFKAPVWFQNIGHLNSFMKTDFTKILPCKIDTCVYRDGVFRMINQSKINKKNPLIPKYKGVNDYKYLVGVYNRFDGLYPAYYEEPKTKEKEKEKDKKTYEGNTDIEEVKKLLTRIPASVKNDIWFSILTTIKCIVKDEDKAYDIADEWSASSPNDYDAKVFGKTWNSIKERNLNYDIQYLEKLADKYNPLKYEFIQEENGNELCEFANLREMNEYDSIKEEFEKEVFKIEKPCRFYVKRTDGEFYLDTQVGLIQSKRDIFYETVDKNDKTKRKRFIDTWLDDGKKKIYEYEEFDPSMKVGKNVFNLFKGFSGVGNGVGDISLILKHFDLLFKEHKDYVLKWFANILQNPTKKSAVSLILHSERQGAGKSLLIDWIAKEIIGKKYFTKTSKPKDDLFDKHSNGVHNKLIVLLEEAKGQDIKPNMDKLNDLITSSETTYQPKNIMSFTIKNYASFIFTTNNENPITIEYSDRRFCGFNCDSQYTQDETYFKPLAEQMEKRETIESFYNYLMSLDLTGINFQKHRPITEYYNELQRINIPSWAKYLSSFIDSNIGLSNGYENRIDAMELYRRYKNYTEFGGYEPITSTSFGVKLKGFYENGITKLRGKKGCKYEFDYDKLKDKMVQMKLYDNDAI